ncbi:17254_t:CDS:2, partial [Gigaspora rosea]
LKHGVLLESIIFGGCVEDFKLKLDGIVGSMWLNKYDLTLLKFVIRQTSLSIKLQKSGNQEHLPVESKNAEINEEAKKKVPVKYIIRNREINVSKPSKVNHPNLNLKFPTLPDDQEKKAKTYH